MIRVAAAVAIIDGKILLADRPADKPPAGWEFPGGKLEPGETTARAIVRELKEELAWQVIPADIIYRLRQKEIVIDFIRVVPCPGSQPVPQEKQHIKWHPLSPELPPGLLPNDREFWRFLTSAVK